MGRYGGHWDDNNEYKFLEWRYGYKKRKVQKAKIKEELSPLAWHPSSGWDWYGGVSLGMKKKNRQKSCGDKYRSLCVWRPDTNFFLAQKEVQIKVSSVMPFAFNAVELYVVTINEKPWTRVREVCKALEYNKKTSDIVRTISSKENYAQNY